ncbi:MAG: hypothetical protein J6Y30_00805 [Treponema sp.]|nr:hypothetical protein [Treponema sp.]
MKKFLCSILAGLLFLSGCSLIDSSNDDGGITLRLPENSGRSVTSEGSLVAEGVSYYVVRLRKDGEVEQEEKASPGSMITIDGLYPGEYTVAILGVDSDGIVQVYGRSPAVEVKPRDTSTASVRLEFVDGMSLRVFFGIFNSDGEYELINSGGASVSVTVSGGGMSYSHTTSENVSEGSGGQDFYNTDGVVTGLPKTVRNFLEPGISYKFSVTAYDSDWDKSYSGSASYTMENGYNSVGVNLR